MRGSFLLCLFVSVSHCSHFTHLRFKRIDTKDMLLLMSGWLFFAGDQSQTVDKGLKALRAHGIAKKLDFGMTSLHFV